MKKLLRNIHLYLSLVTGIFIMIACLTGSIMVFEEEINHLIHSDRYYVEPGKETLSLGNLIKAAEKNNLGLQASAINIYGNPKRSTEISLSEVTKEENKGAGEGNREAKKERGPSENGKGKPSLTVYVDPYTGAVLDVENRRESFFKKVEMIHRFLLSKKEGIGHYIMSYSSFFFFFILLTGLILWWPKNKAILKQRLKIKWNGTTKRLTNDLHVVTGFYTAIFLIVIVMTGLVMSFNWINKGIFTLTSSSTENPKPPKSVLANKGTLSLEKLQFILNRDFKGTESLSVRFPKNEDDAISISSVAYNQSNNTASTYYVDQYSGKIIGKLAFADKNTGQKIRSYIKPIHTGEVFGLTSKIINFIIVILTLTFPVTGVMMWLNRLKKKKKAL